MLDLHVHLDGSLPISVVEELMLLQYSNLNDGLKKLLDDRESLKAKLQVTDECDSLKAYLDCFKLPLELLRTEMSIKIAVKGLLEELKSEGLKYVEIRFAPQLHSNRGWHDSQALEHETAIVKAAIDAAKEVQGIKANFILCLMRGDMNGANLRTLKIAESFKDRGVVAVDLAGDEASFPTSMYKREFYVAREMGLNYTIHAGEAGSAAHRIKSIQTAIDISAKRIGHGVALVLVGYLRNLCKEFDIGIECCPTSNVQTKAIGCLEEHPIYEFMQDGLKVSVNTDNRTVSNTTLDREFDILKVNKEQKEILIKNAIDMAFLSYEEKKEIFPEWVK